MPIQPNGRPLASVTAAHPLQRGGTIALLLVCGGWAAVLAMILAHRIFVTNDSLNNYIHVWYAADEFWGGHGIPLHMPTMGHGQAYAFPYAFVPWMSAALLRPIFGDWIVTLWLVFGFLLLVGAQWWAFPELRGAWWTALLLLDPMLVESPVLGQLPFLWSAAMLFAAIALWRRDRVIAAAVMVGLAQATHPAVMLPIVGPLVLARLYWEPHRARLLIAYAASLVIAAPATLIVLLSPTVEDASTKVLLGNFAGTVSLRAIVIAAPFIALVLQRTPLARVPAALFAFLIVLNIVLVPIRRDRFAWGALTRTPEQTAAEFTRTEAFERGATYRVLGALDGKVSMYQMLQAGARLDSEPFPESLHRNSFKSLAAYERFLTKRHVDYVLIYGAYDRRYGTNEHALLDEIEATPADGALCVRQVVRNDVYEVYHIEHRTCGS